MEQQLKIDLRLKNEAKLDYDISELIGNAVDYCISDDVVIRSKHEAYGILSEKFAITSGKFKSLKTDMAKFLNILPEDDSKAADVVNALSSIFSSSEDLIRDAVILSTFSKKAIMDFYDLESENPALFAEAEEVEDADEEVNDNIKNENSAEKLETESGFELEEAEEFE